MAASDVAHDPVYKIMPHADWLASQSKGLLAWAEIDRQDGFIHLSAADQVVETANKHFEGRDGLWLLTIDAAALPSASLRWEPSRNGWLFPHVYGEIAVSAVVSAEPMPWRDGAFEFPPPFGASAGPP